MDAEALLSQLDLTAKPWFQRDVDAAHLEQALTGRAARENWKYTPISAFVDAYVAQCGPAQPAADLQIDGAEQSGVSTLPLTELTGTDLQSARAALGAVDCERYPLAELAALHNRSGHLIKITGTIADPIFIRHADREQLLLIDVSSDSAVTIIETSEQENFGSTITVLNLAAGSQVDHTHSALQANAMHLSLLSARVAADAAYNLRQYLVGGQKRRSDCHIALEGDNASATVSGAFVTEDGCHLDQQLVMEHRAPHTRSNQTIHGIGMGKSRSVFNGRIHIHPGSGGADAQLRNKNLALDSGADIHTKPELEIYTDDVKCAHGATVGQLDPEHLFYLRSRGLSEVQARSVLCSAFIRSCIHGPLAEPVASRLTECLT